MAHTKTITIDRSNGRESTYELPATYEVCPNCEGEGRVLHEAIRSHAYSAEEFRDSFDDDEAAEYFKGGSGIYGVTCGTCRGERVVLVIDERAVRTRHGATLLMLYHRQQDQRAQWDAEDRYTRMMENGGRE